MSWLFVDLELEEKKGGGGGKQERGKLCLYILHLIKIHTVNLFSKRASQRNTISFVNGEFYAGNGFAIEIKGAPRVALSHTKWNERKGSTSLACSYFLPFWGVRGARLCPAVSGRVWTISFSFFEKRNKKLRVSKTTKQKTKILTLAQLVAGGVLLQIFGWQQIGQLEVWNFFHVVEL